jgi:hypothetical protein
LVFTNQSGCGGAQAVRCCQVARPQYCKSDVA